MEHEPDGSVRLTKELRAQIDDVNRYVNLTIRPVADVISAGKDRSWTVGPSYGDCEDFALTKKNRLLSAGWPSSALLLAIANTRTGEQHAVLIVRTTEGDFVLDNLTSRIRDWRQTHYVWRKIQSPNDQWTWRQII